MFNQTQNLSQIPPSLRFLPLEDAKMQEDSKRLSELLPEFVPLWINCLHEHVCQLHGDAFDEIQASISRVEKIFKRIFPASTLLNPSLQSYQLLDSKEISQAMEKAHQLYQCYKKECIEETALKIPSYFCQKHNLNEKNLPTLQKIASQVLEILRTEILEPEFDLLHTLCTLRIIHYALGIPPSVPHSHTSLVLYLGYSSPRTPIKKS